MERILDEYIRRCSKRTFSVETYTNDTLPEERRDQIKELVLEKDHGCYKNEGLFEEDLDVHFVLMIHKNTVVGYIDYTLIDTDTGTVLYIMYACNSSKFRGKYINILLHCYVFLQALAEDCSLLAVEAETDIIKSILVSKFEFTERNPHSYKKEDEYAKISMDIKKEFNCYYDLREEGANETLIECIRAILTVANCKLQPPTRRRKGKGRKSSKRVLLRI
jgi:hypothetical protein